MPRDREFQRKKKDTRMPDRDSHAEERMDTRQSEPDFNLLRARDAPSSSETARSRRYDTAAQQADNSTPEHLTGRDLDHEPVRESEMQSSLEPEPSAQEPHAGNLHI